MVINLPERLLKEPNIYYITIFSLALLSLAYNSTVGLVYLALIISDLIYTYFVAPSIHSQYQFSSVANNTIMAIGVAIAIYFVFTALASLAITWFQSAATPSSESLSAHLRTATFGSTETIPIFSQNKFIIFGVFTFIIPIIETRAIAGKFMEFLATIFNVKLSLTDLRTYFIFVLVGVAAMVFHFQAKGVTNNVDLIITFLFFALSSALIVFFKEMESAVYLHIINNGRVVANVLGWGI